MSEQLADTGEEDVSPYAVDWAALVSSLTFTPSRGRDPAAVLRQLASGKQPTGRALPSLIPEGLGKQEFLNQSLHVTHPFAIPPALPEYVADALRQQPRHANDLIRHREQALHTLLRLASELAGEAEKARAALDEHLIPTAGRLHLPLIRYLADSVDYPDKGFVDRLARGKAMAGQRPLDCIFPTRSVQAQVSIQDLLSSAAAANARVLASCGPSGDPDLDEESWSLSEAEFEDGTLWGPWGDVAEIPFHEYCLLPRRPIWEQRAGGRRKCRNIDDASASGGRQNDTCARENTYIPHTLDDWAAYLRAVQEEFPNDNLLGFPADFTKAYRQDPACPSQLHLFVVAIWNPREQKVVFAAARAQLFGSGSAPINWAEVPTFLCWVAAKLLYIPFLFCVDDCFTAERASTSFSAWLGWQLLICLCGWRLDPIKSLLPSGVFKLLGSITDLTATPEGPPKIHISDERCVNLSADILDVLASGKLPPARAGQMFGRLQHAGYHFFGRYGCAMLRSLKRRQFENGRQNLNQQLVAQLLWWLGALQHAPQREVLWRISERNVVTSFSDGEGSYSVAYVVFSSRFHDKRPRAAQGWVPSHLRALHDQRVNDIMNIEAYGPLLVVQNHGKLMENSLWLHFIDNESALLSMVKGSASVADCDRIVGYTWGLLAKHKILPYFARVDSSSNPIDGLSRLEQDDMGLNWVREELSWPTDVDIQQPWS